MKTKDAIKWFGTTKRLADALEIQAPAVYQWKKFPPALRQLQIQHLTEGALKAEPACLVANAVPAASKGTR